MLLSEGQMSDYKGAALMFASLPKAKAMIADKGTVRNFVCGRARLVRRSSTMSQR